MRNVRYLTECIKKTCHKRWSSSAKRGMSLHPLRDNEKREVDFLITVVNRPVEPIEVMLPEDTFARNLPYYTERFPEARACQTVHDLPRSKSRGCIRMTVAADFLINRKAWSRPATASYATGAPLITEGGGMPYRETVPVADRNVFLATSLFSDNELHDPSYDRTALRHP